MKRYPTVLTIAGSDSSGGAGIQADLKTIAALGAYGASAVTALTAQNTRGVLAIHPVPPAFLKQQLEAVFEDLQVDAVKIGMINTPESARIIADILDTYAPAFVVFDPVMVSTSGAKLIEDTTINELWDTLFPRAHLITPNLDEAQWLTSHTLDTPAAMQDAALWLIQRGCRGVLVKGGHLPGERLFDVFVQEGQAPIQFETPYINSKNLHGTGCTLSSAIATNVALGHPLPEAVFLAKAYIAGAIEAGKDVLTGHGHGPLNHSFDPKVMNIK